jgi:hypothetical protein
MKNRVISLGLVLLTLLPLLPILSLSNTSEAVQPHLDAWFALVDGNGFMHESEFELPGNGTFAIATTFNPGNEITHIDSLHIGMWGLIPRGWENASVRFDEIYIDTLFNGTFVYDVRARNESSGFFDSTVYAEINFPRAWNVVVMFTVSGMVCHICDNETCTCCDICGEFDCDCCSVCRQEICICNVLCPNCGTGGRIAPPAAGAASRTFVNSNTSNAPGGNPANGTVHIDVLHLIHGTNIKPHHIYALRAEYANVSGPQTDLVTLRVTTDSGMVESPLFRSETTISSTAYPQDVLVQRTSPRVATWFNGATGNGTRNPVVPSPRAAFATARTSVFDVFVTNHRSDDSRARLVSFSLLDMNGEILGTAAFNPAANSWNLFESFNCAVCAQCGDCICICCPDCGWAVCVCCNVCRHPGFCVCCGVCGGGALWCSMCCNTCRRLTFFCQCVPCTGIRNTCTNLNCATCPPRGTPHAGDRAVQLVALDAANDVLHRSAAIVLDDYNRTYRATLNLPNRPGESITQFLQIGLLSEGGIFDYEPADGILPFADIRQAPSVWDGGRLVVNRVTINGDIVVTPQGAGADVSLIEPRGGWYATAGYVNYMLWNAWHPARHNRLTGVNTVTIPDASGERVPGFMLPGGAAVTTIEIEFSTARMPAGNPPPCTGSPLTCRVPNCLECAVTFVPPAEGETLSIVVDGTRNLISYYNDTAISGAFSHSFNVSGNLWDIMPNRWPVGSIPMLLRNHESGDSSIAGMISGTVAAGSVIATQNFTGCAHKIAFAGTTLSRVTIIGDCICTSAMQCNDCGLSPCVCCDTCGGNPEICCWDCARICGECRFCTAGSGTPTLRAAICHVTNTIRYYNNTTIWNDFDFRFTVHGDVWDVMRPNGNNGQQWPVGTLGFPLMNPATGDVAIAGVMGEPWAAGRLFAIQDFNGDPNDIRIDVGGIITRVDRITCTGCARFPCICCQDCGLVDCICETCRECGRATADCRCCRNCRQYSCACQGLRLVIDRESGLISYFTNAELNNTSFFYRLSLVENVGEVTFVDPRVDAEVTLTPTRVILSGTVRGRVPAGALIATQPFAGCGRAVQIPQTAEDSIINITVNCDCTLCRGNAPVGVPTLNVVVDVANKLIRYYNNSEINGDFHYQFTARGDVGDIREPSGADGPRWPRGSSPLNIVNPANGDSVIAGIMGDTWAAGNLLALQSFNGSAEALDIPVGGAIRQVVFIGCETCSRIRCACFTFIRGDVNNDGKVDVLDALQILRFLVGLSSDIEVAPFPQVCTVGYNAARSVVSYGGNPAISDALQILRHTVGLSSSLDRDFTCRQCGLVECVCQGAMRVEIDARTNTLRFFHDTPIIAGADLAYTFKIGGEGILVNRDPLHHCPQEFTPMFENSGSNSMANNNEVLFAAIIERATVPAGTPIATMRFEGNAENLEFLPDPFARHPFPIGNVIVIA